MSLDINIFTEFSKYRFTEISKHRNEVNRVSELVAEYGQLLGEIKQRIRSAQYAALKAVNKELIVLYWDIGELIVER